MTKEEKAKAYDDAIKRAKAIIKVAEKEEAYKSAITIFPELRESEDERIRKDIIWCLKHSGLKESSPINPHVTTTTKDAIAWLEKQGEQKPADKAERKGMNIVEEDMTPFQKKVFCIIDTTIEEEQGLKQVCDELLRLAHYEIMQNPFDYENANVQQKDFTPKVEPKFKVDDWVAYNNPNAVSPICQITKIDRDIIDLKGLQGERFQTECWDLNENYHLWSIEDTKAGDVLVTKKSKRPFIFKGLLDPKHPNCPVAYCGIDSEDIFIDSEDIFIVSTGIYWWTNEKVYPATKEQRALLFQRMKEAGYEWDAEKKELKENKL